MSHLGLDSDAQAHICASGDATAGELPGKNIALVEQSQPRQPQACKPCLTHVVLCYGMVVHDSDRCLNPTCGKLRKDDSVILTWWYSFGVESVRASLPVVSLNLSIDTCARYCLIFIHSSVTQQDSGARFPFSSWQEILTAGLSSE